MIFLGLIGSVVLVLIVLDLWDLKQRAGLLELESQYPADIAAVWLQIARGYRCVAKDAPNSFVWERGRGFDDGGFLYWGRTWRHKHTGRGRFVIGVIGHKYHTREELAAARAQFVSTQLFHLTEKSAETAIARASDPRTARAVNPEARKLADKRPTRPPAIDAPMSPAALRFTLRVPLDAVKEAIDELPAKGWRRLDSASLSRGLVTQHRYAFEDAPERKDASAEYLLELRWYDGDWAMLAIDWFPRPGATRPRRSPTELEAEIRRAVEGVLVVPEAAE
jgi:hypothetical protein